MALDVVEGTSATAAMIGLVDAGAGLGRRVGAVESPVCPGWGVPAWGEVISSSAALTSSIPTGTDLASKPFALLAAAGGLGLTLAG